MRQKTNSYVRVRVRWERGAGGCRVCPTGSASENIENYILWTQIYNKHLVFTNVVHTCPFPKKEVTNKTQNDKFVFKSLMAEMDVFVKGKRAGYLAI